MGVDATFPELLTLHANPTRSDWNAPVYNSIIANSPNLHTLKFSGSWKTGWYDGPLWSTNLPSLKCLILNEADAILEGVVFDIEKFKGLSSLEINSIPSLKIASVQNFFRVVGATLTSFGIKMGFYRVQYQSLASELWNSLPFLETLNILDGSIGTTAILPTTITRIKLHHFGDLERIGNLVNLKHLTLANQLESFQYSQFPLLESITIIEAKSAATILESIPNLRVDMINFKVLRLGRYQVRGGFMKLSKSLELISRFEELGIELKY